jgi:hypothetical protein
MNKPYAERRIFWDVDADKLDFEKRAAFIIERVFERGDVEDIRMCRRFYGDERVAEVLQNAKWLSLETMHLASAIFNRQLSNFLCYRQMQSNPERLKY